MSLKILLVLCLTMSISLCFATNCAKFNLQNFNICTECAQKYYLSNSKCVTCTDATSSLPQCTAKSTTADKSQDINQTSSTNQNRLNQTLVNNSQNDSNKTKSNSENVAAKQPQSNDKRNQAVKSPVSVVSNPASPNSIVNSSLSATAATASTDNANSVSKMPLNNAIPTAKTSPSIATFLQTQAELANCYQFAITNEGIKCTGCKDKFILTAQNRCVPSNATINGTTRPIQKSNAETTKNTDNSLKSSNEIQKEKMISIGTINGSLVEKVDSKLSTNQENNSSTQITTFMPIIPNQPTTVSQFKTTSIKPSQNQSSISTNIFYSTPSLDPVSTNVNIQNANTNENTNNSADISKILSSTQITASAGQDVITTYSPPNLISVTPPKLPPSIAITNNTQQTVKYPTPNRPKDLNCAQINSKFSQKQPISRQNSRCLQCYKGYYYNVTEQICKPNNPNCKTTDDQNTCLSCYPGYITNNGDCIIVQPQPQLSILVTSRSPSSNSAQNFNYKQPDPNCRQFIPATNLCLLCATNFYLSNEICVRADPLCKTYNQSNGNCLNCYVGYYLNTKTQPNTCSLSPTSNCTNLKNCSCPQGSYLSNGSCLSVSLLCKTYNISNGECMSCYLGYALITGICKMIQQIIDPFCYTNGPSGCIECIDYYYPDTTGVCQPVNGLCYGYNKKTGDCTGCYPLYTLQNGTCVYVYLNY